MTLDEVMEQLEAMGTAQNREVYARHGVGPEMFGVSYGNLSALRRKLPADHELAQELWATGNHDARVFATMLADPEKSTRELLESWAEDLDSYVLTDAFSSFVARTPHARDLAELWQSSDEEWTGQAGWNLVSHLARSGGLSDDELSTRIPVIEARIDEAPNRVRHAMNMALIAIGLRSEPLREQVLASAELIGPVEVDHGETSCVTPEVGPYIERALARQAARAS